VRQPESGRTVDPGGGPPVAPTEPCAVAFSDVTVTFDGFTAVENVQLNVRPGEIVALIGPSGCGKSTLLNAVAGVVRPSTGTVSFFGNEVTRLNTEATYLTQRDTLLPWRSVLDNAALPLEIKRIPKRQRHERAREVLASVGLDRVEDSRIHTLSGGMRSRVALARSLVVDSPLILMDEPFAALDAILRLRMQQLLLHLFEATAKTILYVTHDLNEAIALADRVVVMGGRPGHILGQRAIDIPRPRIADDVRVMDRAVELYRDLWSLIDDAATTAYGSASS
jgi:NitT/TauT family transport system ATP-binding protein